MKNISKKSNITRQSILTVFFNEIKQKRVEKITISHLAQVTNLNRSTIYQYFLDTYDILEQLEDDTIFAIQNKLLSTLQSKEYQDIEQFLPVVEEFTERIYYLSQTSQGHNFKLKLLVTLEPFFIQLHQLQIQDNNINFQLYIVQHAIFNAINYWYEHPEKDLLDYLKQLQQLILIQ
ncbi:TPA: TetR/AcrR family transcriptional regulator [Streptococcus suis]